MADKIVPDTTDFSEQVVKKLTTTNKYTGQQRKKLDTINETLQENTLGTSDIVASVNEAARLEVQANELKEKKDAENKKLEESAFKETRKGFKGMILTAKDGLDKLYNEQKSAKEIFSDIGDGFKSDFQMFSNLLAPLQAIPGMNTAIQLLSGAGTFFLKGIFALATAEGRQKAIEWAAQKKQWAAEKLAAVKERVRAMSRDQDFVGPQIPGEEKGGLLMFVKNLFKMVRVALAVLVAFFVGGIVGLGLAVKNIYSFILPKQLKDAFKNTGKSIRSYFGAFSNTVKSLIPSPKEGGLVSRAIGSISSGFQKFMGKIKPMVDGIKNLIKNPMVQKAANFGKTLGKLFFPLTILMSAWEAIKGAMSGFTNTEGNLFEKIVGGLMGAVENLVKFFIAMPLDLIKDLIGWIAGMLGFDGIKEGLASFSFADIFSKLFDFLFSITSYISALVSAMANGAFEAIKALWPGGEGPIEAFNRGYNESMDARGRNPDTGGKIDEASMENKHEEIEVKRGNSNPSGGSMTNVTTTVNNSKKVISVADTSPVDQTAIAAAGGF